MISDSSISNNKPKLNHLYQKRIYSNYQITFLWTEDGVDITVGDNDIVIPLYNIQVDYDEIDCCFCVVKLSGKEDAKFGYFTGVWFLNFREIT
jgi:hypothetical protein